MLRIQFLHNSLVFQRLVLPVWGTARKQYLVVDVDGGLLKKKIYRST